MIGKMVQRLAKTRLRGLLGPWGKRAQYFAHYPRQLLWPDVDVMAQTSRGLTMVCSHENYIEREILATGLFEATSTQAVIDVVRPGQVVLDVGANIGYYTLLLADLVGPTGAVHAFEPTRWAFQRSLRNLLMNRRLRDTPVVMNQLGLLAAPTAGVSAIESRFSGKTLAHSEPEHMRFTTIDVYCAERGIARVDFMKIDVDGHDLDVLRGAEKTIARDGPVLLCEFCDRVLEPHGDSVPKYVAWLADHGYTEGIVFEGPLAGPRQLADLVRPGMGPADYGGSINVLTRRNDAG